MDRSVFLDAFSIIVVPDTDLPLAIVDDVVRRNDGLGIRTGGRPAASTAFVMWSADCCKVNEQRILRSFRGPLEISTRNSRGSHNERTLRASSHLS